ncbi:MAG: prepilin-type N-terminal cleavage/methylation domain-containing protein [Synergistaceae bacterium]|nr:prepilin-type N-terminal cleavage/methylation domain-containing protein [Synergistaceae bacterium]MBQ7169686.1 prepilin-type N-terminal cleavage/methylation domain-containing protein [Synergistaceae bacterium]
MKRTRKGFTLIELLIVVAIMGALAAMMAASSADSVDVAAASAILNNLQSMKSAAYEMYTEEPAVAGLAAIADGDTAVTGSSTGNTVKAVLGKYLGRIDIATNYGIVGDKDAWYVYYELQATDSAKVKAKLAGMANRVGLLGASGKTLAILSAVTAYYSDTSETASTVVALRVR